ncbi:hypothetical protein E2C01_079907 [Portunus trituberculatus]|uniref:Uncharacterized protein n=1 Tax=Portunus trituberculatus TaxID=210409 RepID=A0A5B7IRS3_PORTR|nr:hypothetical protein [Portunus trituberculatus]
MSGNKLYSHLKCVARADTLQEAPSRLRLSVRQPRQGCLPWCPKKHTVATLCFKEALWQQGDSGEYGQTVECKVKNLAKLRRLEADLPVKVKCWTKGLTSKVLLQDSLGVLLDKLEGSSASEAWLAFTAIGQKQQVCWQPADHQDGTAADAPLSDDAMGDSADPSLDYDNLWDSRGENTPVEDDLSPLTPAPCVTSGGEGGDGDWVTFFNTSTGKTLRLPHHTKEKAAERWRGPGAWTSEDDLLSVRALRIVEGIQPVMKRMRLPEGPHWWEMASVGTAAAAATAERAEQQDTSLLPPDWSLPAFPGITAAPCHCGVSEAGVPEMPLPTHGRRGGAARDSRRRRQRRPRSFLTVVAALAYMILVPWLAFHGDNILDAISGRVDGWVRMCFNGWMLFSGLVYMIEWLGE